MLIFSPLSEKKHITKAKQVEALFFGETVKRENTPAQASTDPARFDRSGCCRGHAWEDDTALPEF
jgi:hypothetical protein